MFILNFRIYRCRTSLRQQSLWIGLPLNRGLFLKFIHVWNNHSEFSTQPHFHGDQSCAFWRRWWGCCGARSLSPGLPLLALRLFFYHWFVGGGLLAISLLPQATPGTQQQKFEASHGYWKAWYGKVNILNQWRHYTRQLHECRFILTLSFRSKL